MRWFNVSAVMQTLDDRRSNDGCGPPQPVLTAAVARWNPPATKRIRGLIAAASATINTMPSGALVVAVTMRHDHEIALPRGLSPTPHCV